MRKGDELTGGHYLAFPTVAETLHSRGMRTVIAGGKGVVLLHDRAARSSNSLGINLFAGEVLPEGVLHRQAQKPANYHLLQPSMLVAAVRSQWGLRRTEKSGWRRLVLIGIKRPSWSYDN